MVDLFLHNLVRRDDGRKNEFSALIIAKMAIKICESNSGASRDDRRKNGRRCELRPELLDQVGKACLLALSWSWGWLGEVCTPAQGLGRRLLAKALGGRLNARS